MLKGKTALVTGSTSGIGLGIALTLAKQGANVVLNGFGAFEAARDEVAATGVKVGYHGADMSKPDEIAGMIEYAKKDFDGVDILVNNAARSIRRPVADSLERWHDIERLMQLNYMGPLRLIRASASRW